MATPEQSEDLQKLDEAEKAIIIQSIDANQFTQRAGKWRFRKGMTLADYFGRIVVLICLAFIAMLLPADSPRGEKNRKWLVEFSIVMSVWFTAVHALIYLPRMVFTDAKDVWDSLWGHCRHAYENWREYQYAAFIIVFIMIVYPFALFFFLIVDGFDPYEGLTHKQMKVETRTISRICYIFRLVMHSFMIIVAVYLLIMTIVFKFMRSTTSYAGKWNWMARSLSKFPYGSMFYQPGEFFDCGICLRGIWSEAQCIKLACSVDDICVFHSCCIREQIVQGNRFCVNCGQVVAVASPPPPEEGDGAMCGL